MATALLMEDDPMDIDQQCTGMHQLLFRGLTHNKMEDKRKKIQIKLQSLCQNLLLGEVQEVFWNELHCVKVNVKCVAAANCLKKITLAISGEPDHTATNGAVPTRFRSAVPEATRSQPTEGLAAQEVHQLQIGGLTGIEDHLPKIADYLQQVSKALHLGMVHKVSYDMELCFLFVDYSTAEECFQNITLELDGEPCHLTYNQMIPIGDNTDYPGLQNRARGRHGSCNIVMSPGRAEQPKFHMPTMVKLDLKAVEPHLLDDVRELIHRSNLKTSPLTNETVMIEGSFEDVALYFQSVIHLYNKVSDEQIAHGKEEGAWGGSKPLTVTKNMEPFRSEEPKQNPVRLSLFHYDYLVHAYADKISAFKEQHQVDFQGEVLLSLTDKVQKERPCRKVAHEAFTQLIQPLFDDLGRVKLPISDFERPCVLKAIKTIRKKKPSFTLIAEKEECIITGPKPGLDQVKRELIDLLQNRLEGKTIVKVMNEMTAAFTAMEIPRVHWELLQNLFNEELDSIAIKYGVQIDLHALSSGSNVKILIKNQNGNLDLSANALQGFASLYQQAMTGYVTRAVDNSNKNRVAELFLKLGPTHPDVRLIPAKGGGLSLMGPPQHVEPVVQNIQKHLGEKVFLIPPRERVGFPGRPTLREADKELQAGGTGENNDDKCCICLDNFTNKFTTVCKHSFCKECWERAMASNPQCPVCKTAYGKIEGNQPPGTMKHTRNEYCHLPGFGPRCGTIEIEYFFPDGIQLEGHPHPGERYHGTSRTAYLPDNMEGQEVLRLLIKAFNQKLTFTVGESRTTGMKNVVTWNDIHHKTSTHGGPASFGYPDPDYLRRVKEELRAKGIQ
ncbi:E3 ubiquitin-protein ligase DTX3L-like isoform X2 [Ambystoma mexicanum]|uniref:E3 ubiquitin-protein ligase DTX3L-like isoform X2 n=1 Tax=Ambystoma mexicanum TaxID=8296 RepID=UPI0037E9753B